MEKIFIDTNSFIFFLTDDGERADRFEDILYNKNNEIYTSYNVLNEVKFILLIHKAMQILKTNKKWELIKFIKTNQTLRKEIIEKYTNFYVNIKSKIKILDNDEDTDLLSCTLLVNYGLLPTDASIASLMINKNINKILTDDSDFKKVSSIEVIKV